MWKITRYNWPLLIECLWYLQKWDKVISKKPYAQWKHHLNSQQTNGTNLPEQKLQQISKHINVLVRHYPKEFNCMRRSLALKSIIERRCGACKMHIGVKFEEANEVSPAYSQTPKVAAHAWISVNNTIINDTPEKIAENKEITRDNTLFSNASINS
jgi:hypothetical protein